MNSKQMAQRTNDTDDGNVADDGSTSQVVKAEDGSTIIGVTQVAGDYYAGPPPPPPPHPPPPPPRRAPAPPPPPPRHRPTSPAATSNWTPWPRP